MPRLIRHALRPPMVGRAVRALAFVVVATMLTIGSAPATLAAAQDPDALNPVPPDFYTCRAAGSGAICRAHTVDQYSGEATGIFCGSGESIVELLDNGIRDVEATRWYDGNGDLIRRVRMTLFRDSYWSNPATGLTLDYQQHNTDIDDLAVPGDLASSTFTGHGQLTVTIPGVGRVIKEAGRAVVGPSGDIESQAGPTDLSDYYNGLTSIVDPICARLGTRNS